MSTIKSWAEADEAIKKLGLWQIKRDRLEGELNKQITALKEKHAGTIAAADIVIADETARLEAWCDNNQGGMTPTDTGGHTWKGAFGKLAWRKCPAAIKFTVKNLEKVVAALKARKLFNCVRTVEEPNKEAMALLDKDTLAAVGARKGADHKFEVKPDYTKIEPATEDAA